MCRPSRSEYHPCASRRIEREYRCSPRALARQEEPDMCAYADPEIVTTIRKQHRDFFATAPAPERPVE
jgi:hypothetical protein